ncbi:MAG: Do family serine endopeptidase [Gemmatimonadota bacterium]
MHDPLKSKGRIVAFSSLAFVFGVGLTSGLGWTANSVAMPAVSSQPQLADAAVRPALDLSEAFVNISEAVTPAVVRIETQRPRTASRGRQDPSAIPEPFRRFFEMPEGQGGQAPPPQIAGGSGFIVSTDGYILTNDHVVSGVDVITVFLQDRRQFRAELVGTDPTTDVAVIKIEAENLPTLSFGDSDAVRVGEWILAVGNPGFGGGSQLDYTVTAGIISAKGRPLGLIQGELQRNPQMGEAAPFAIEDFIQTDAVINPGNSGGPMVDLRGQVVGINSAIASRTGFYQGYGFAIPIGLARRVMEDLVEFGRVRRPWLGIEIVDVQPEDAEVYGLPTVSGVLVQNLPDNSPAREAGLRSEDVIVAIDGTEVGRTGALQNKVAQYRPGDRVTVSLYRNQQRQDITVRLGEAPFSAEPPPVRTAEVRAEEKLGIQVRELTADAARQLGYDVPGGVIIEDVAPAGPAGRRGVAPGLKLVEINSQTITSPEDVRGALEQVDPGEVVTLRLESPDGARRVVNIRIPE